MGWGNTYEFIFTCLLYVVGLGNILRFPQLAYINGGGTFLIPYLINLALLGTPLFYLEVAIGQYNSLGPITIWKLSPLFKGVGYGVVLSNILTTISYQTTISWSVYYIFASMQKVMPWSQCSEGYPFDACINGTHTARNTTIRSLKWSDRNNSMFEGRTTPAHLTGADRTNLESKTLFQDTTTLTVQSLNSTLSRSYQVHSSQQFFYREFLKVSEGLEDYGYPHWRLCLCLLLTWTLVFLILAKGVKSSGKIALALTPFCYILLTAFLIQSFVLDSPGAERGIRYFLTPQWEYLKQPSVWYDAATQVFFSLSLMQGGLITLSSYNKFDHNIHRAAILIPVLDTITSLFASLAFFSVLGVMANEHSADMSEVFRGSTGIALVVFSEAAAMMPLPHLWSVLFFLMLMFLGIGTLYIAVETVVTAITDEYPQRLTKKRIKIIGTFGVAMFILGVPLTCRGGVYLQTLLDKFTSSQATIILALVLNIALAWVYGTNQLGTDIKSMLSHELNIVWKVLWKVVTPVLLMTMLVLGFISYTPLHVKTYYSDYELPVWARVIGWLIFTAQIIPVIAYGVTLYLTTPSAPFRKKIAKLASPISLWGPDFEMDRLESNSSSTEDNSQVTRRVFDKNSSETVTTSTTTSNPGNKVKTGNDIGGLDSIFSATVGNNVLVKMAMNLTSHSKAPAPSRSSLNRTSRIRSSADLLAKRKENLDGGPIMFEEDGETYMLVPKRKNRPPSVDKSTQTSPRVKRSTKDGSVIPLLLCDSSRSAGANDGSNVIIQSNIKLTLGDCAEQGGSKSTVADNPAIVIESV